MGIKEMRIEKRSIHSSNGVGRIKFIISINKGIFPVNPIILGISDAYWNNNVPNINNATTYPPKAIIENRLCPIPKDLSRLNTPTKIIPILPVTPESNANLYKINLFLISIWQEDFILLDK